MFEFVIKIKNYYERFERFNPFVFFFGGFTWDSITLRRIDQIFDNLILLAYLLLLGGLVVLTSLLEEGKIHRPFLLKYKRWFPLGLQFFLGGLFSAYVIYYFQSASFTKTALFLGLLAMLLISNEFLSHRLQNVYLLLCLYFFAAFSFFIFFIPVISKVMNVLSFLTGGLLSLLLTMGIARYLYKKLVFPNKKQFLKAGVLLLLLYAGINTLYFFNWIPPVPLSMKSAGIYHHASRQPDDMFMLRFEKPKWYQFFKNSDRTYHYAEGDTVSCFTAVFAPVELKTNIVHHWQKQEAASGDWTTTDRLGFEIIGHREGGYRGITRKRNVSTGKWRVNIETQEGQLLGRIGFHIEPATEKSVLKTIFR